MQNYISQITILFEEILFQKHVCINYSVEDKRQKWCM